MTTPTSTPNDLPVFELAHARLHWAATTGPALLPRDASPAQLSALAAGLLLGVHAFSTPQDLHEDQWELHPAGDEIILVTAGAVDLERHGPGGTQRTALAAGQGTIVPAGTWHRFRLRQPGQLVALTTHQGTRLSPTPA